MAKSADIKAEGKPVTVEDRVAALEASNNSIWAKVNKIVKTLERMFGFDVDRDGKVGGGRILALAVLAVLVATAVYVGAAVVGGWSETGAGGIGTAQFSSSDKQTTLTIDKLVVTNGATITGTLQASAIGLTGRTIAGSNIVFNTVGETNIASGAIGTRVLATATTNLMQTTAEAQKVAATNLSQIGFSAADAVIRTNAEITAEGVAITISTNLAYAMVNQKIAATNLSEIGFSAADAVILTNATTTAEAWSVLTSTNLSEIGFTAKDLVAATNFPSSVTGVTTNRELVCGTNWLVSYIWAGGHAKTRTEIAAE
jgi:hypothetical protein